MGCCGTGASRSTVIAFARPAVCVVLSSFFFSCRVRPVGNNPKEQQFLQELEDLFEYIKVEDFASFFEPFKHRFVQLLEAPHFQTTERALWFFRNPCFVSLGVNHTEFGTALLRAFFEPLQQNTLEHWHDSVKTISAETLKHYKAEHPQVYQQCVDAYNLKVASQGNNNVAGTGHQGDVPHLPAPNGTNQTS